MPRVELLNPQLEAVRRKHIKSFVFAVKGDCGALWFPALSLSFFEVNSFLSCMIPPACVIIGPQRMSQPIKEPV